MVVELSGIRFSYNSKPVLDNISFQIDKPGLICILGVNGAGKSTLLKCINRILRPKAGAVLIENQDIKEIHPKEIARKMGYVPQRHREEEITVYEAILLGRKPHINWVLREEDHLIVEQIIEELGLRDLAMRSVLSLSGGEFQKVLIARALAQEPKVLLLDEPISNLDLKNQLEVMELIKKIVNTKGVTCFMAIHDLNTAIRYGDLFILLKDHKVHGICKKENITPSLLEEVYQVPVKLLELEDRLLVIPMGLQ